MSEKVALSCIFCNHGSIARVPNSHHALLEMIEHLRKCPDCGTVNELIQRSWVNDYGQFGNPY